MVKFIGKLWGYLTGLIVIGIVVYIVLLWATSQAITAELTTIKTVKYNPIGNKVKTCFIAQVNNSGYMDVVIEKLYYKVYVNNKYLGEGVRENILIKRGVNNIDFCLEAESREIVSSLVSTTLRGGRAKVMIEGYVEIPIKSFGVVKLWTLQIPFEKTVEVEIQTYTQR